MTQFLRQTNYQSACLVLAALFALIGSPTAKAGTVVWANNASLGSPHIHAYDLDTGQNLADFAAPHPDASKGKANGRGIAVVGQTIYYTLANSGSVYMTDTNSHSDLGIAFSTPLAGIGAISWDGSGLWVIPYVGLGFFNAHSDNAYKYSLSGALLQTVALTPPGFNGFAGNTEPRSGFAATPNGFVTDRGPSVPYDAYDLNGNLITPFLITSQFRSSGIAFDGTNYIVSDVVNSALSVYDGNGVFIRMVPLSGAVIPFGLEGLSAVVTSAPPVTAGPPAVTPAVTAVLLNPTSVVGGGAPLTGTVILGSPAPAGGATIVLTADNPTVAFPAVSTVTIPAGASSATFPVTTAAVTSASFSVISANFNSASVSATLTVLAPYSLASLALNPTSVLAGFPAQGTLTLTGPADTGAVVTLTSGNPAALTVPPTVTVPPGATSVTFSANSLPVSGTVIVTATLNTGVLTASVQIIAPAASADTVTINKVELVLKTMIMRVEATSTNPAASLQVTADVAGANVPIADLIDAGGGKYIGQFAVSLEYQNINVKSSLGGSAVSTVTQK
jgi:hypothetical protein